MRPFNVKLMCCIGLLAGLAIIIGCGSGGDLLDEPGTRHTAYAVPQDSGTDTQEIDVWAHDCNGTPEGILPFSVKVVISTDANAADFYVESYDVYFRPNEGTYCEADPALTTFPGCTWEDLTAAEMPTLAGSVLNPRHFNFSSSVVKKNSTVTISGMLVWTQGDKAFYGDTALNVEPFGEEIIDPVSGLSLGFEEETADLTYDMQVVLNCRTVENEDFSITTPWTPVHFLDVDNCSST